MLLLQFFKPNEINFFEKQGRFNKARYHTFIYKYKYLKFLIFHYITTRKNTIKYEKYNKHRVKNFNKYQQGFINLGFEKDFLIEIEKDFLLKINDKHLVDYYQQYYKKRKGIFNYE